MEIEFEAAGEIEVESGTEIAAEATRASVVGMIPCVESQSGKRIDVKAAGQAERKLHVTTNSECRIIMIAKYVINLRCDTNMGNKSILEIQSGVTAVVMGGEPACYSKSFFTLIKRRGRSLHRACQREQSNRAKQDFR